MNSQSLRKLIELNIIVAEVNPAILTITRWDEVELGSYALHPMMWAAMDGWFNDHGLEADHDRGEPMCNGKKGLEALYDFFGVDKIIIDMICMEKHYPDPTNVTKLDIVARITHVCQILEMELQDA